MLYIVSLLDILNFNSILLSSLINIQFVFDLILSLFKILVLFNNGNRFRFCPKCGRELTKEDFGGVDFVNEPDMREKIKEYIGELDTEMIDFYKNNHKLSKYNVE